MLYFSIATAVFVAIGMFCMWRGLSADYYDGDGWFISGWIALIVAFILGIFLLIIGISRPVGRSTCANWSRQTGVTTKFVLLNWADTGTCLARTPDGHWIQNTNWNAYVGVNNR